MPDRTLVEQWDQAIESVLAGTLPAAGSDTKLAALAEIAGRLRDLPAKGFKIRLKADLQRRSVMTTSASTVAGISAGFRTVTPFITHDKASELYEEHFQSRGVEAQHGWRGYGFYSEVRIGDSGMMIGGGTAARWGNLPGALHVYVEDCDAAYQRASKPERSR